MEENDNIEKITLEKQKKPVSEKQRENLKKMRERKRELSMTRVKSEPPLEYSPPKHTQPQPQPHHQPQQKSMVSRIEDLERYMYEQKIRKQVKAELKNKIEVARIKRNKAVDRETEEEEEKNIKENTHTFNYNSLFY